ncbi:MULTISPECIES: type II toxin-antitoxin system HicA family toxin [Citrobacter]|uniref:type II toxin-antitoxin system HicA family toxin n=1 Tax=Citrobacter TaxID=544 RepID=UPI0005A79137|nr:MULTISPECIES: type II toxin-antitoxin system HicA family toxin [Citrobacter]EHG7611223.1 type II toxin-antitoxin system HicA family toxin [Citrobacter sedlakii]EKJ8219642.1 type II toxin-antitoxin system HicA family toxin [Citrobacter sedlakii]KSY28812.1 hexulose-6-phosphate synthase [Citrobacter sp. 50677481]MBJ9889303.1 type II toxin-antitoxin system HicA family toxin [Citrobacter sedlakii]MBM9568212.1 type II toxin-antitoxin system HicA family toxin [Citrobacter sedlakii]
MRQQVLSLRKKQRNTLEQLFKTPVPQAIKWLDIESLVKALGGEIKEGRGSRCKFLLNNSIACFHRPHPSPDTDKGAVESVRDWLISIGVKP